MTFHFMSRKKKRRDQSRFDHPDLTNFGRSQLWPIQFWCYGGALKGGGPQKTNGTKKNTRAQAISLKRGVAFAHDEVWLFCVSFCVPSQPCIFLMPRRGWSAMDVPSGWVQILRGPRPRSVRWPRAPAQRPHRPGSPKDAQQMEWCLCIH